MRTLLTLLVSAFLYGTATAAFAQNVNDIIDRVQGIVQSAVTKAAQSEWRKLPQTEFSCVNQKLQERGESIDSFIKRGILPSDSRVSDLRSECRTSQVSPPLDQRSAQSKYVVDGIAAGSRVNTDSASYREYRCSPSEQFDGFTWCQKTRNERERGGPYSATYSILHSSDGKVLYVNRYQEPAFFTANQAEDDIQRYSRKIGEPARITKVPHRADLPDGVVALWGKTTLEQLDQDSIRTLAEGKSPKKGLLLDSIGNFARSAREGLPIYRIGGGAGFIWTASFEQKGRGTLRFTAVDASGLPSPSASQSPSGSQSPAQPTEIGNEVDAKLPELKRTIEELQADLVVAASRVADLEKGKSEAKRAIKEAEKAKGEAEQTRMSERVKLDAVIAQLQADKAAADAKNGGWKSLAYGGIGGLLVVVTAFTAFFCHESTKVKDVETPSFGA